MKYIFALVLPPFAMLMDGRMVQAAFCGILFFLSLVSVPFGIGFVGLAGCMVWGLLVVAMTDPVRSNLHEMDFLEQRHTHPHPPVKL